MPAVQTMLSASACGRRVTIGVEPTAELRHLSDARQTRCPLCGAPVVLRAGRVVAPHFAHLPGAACAHPHAEPETDEHRTGKSLVAAWAARTLPCAVVTVEAPIPETGQRADVLLERVERDPGERIALEYQCADLPAREWQRRHTLYRAAGIRDLWLLGGSRLAFADGALRTSELERALMEAGAPLLFLDSTGEHLDAGTLARFRPAAPAPAVFAPGRLSARPLDTLAFPHSLLDWPARAADTMPPAPSAARGRPRTPPSAATPDETRRADDEARLLRWLRLRCGATEEGLPALFGIPVPASAAFGCSDRLWQACVYYRWVHGRVGQPWWLEEINRWARRHLPIARPDSRLVYRALAEFQDLLSAAGMLTLPSAPGRARVLADLPTLASVPEPQAVRRLAAYRRTLRKEQG